MRNIDRIKKMTVDEMAEWLSNRAGCCFCIYEFTECKGYKWYWNKKPLFNNGGFHAILIKEVTE